MNLGFKIALYGLLTSLVCAACTSCGVTVNRVDPGNVQRVEEPTRSWALAIADAEAEIVLKEYNSGDQEVVARSGGPFHLDQYDREILRLPTGDKKLLVFYESRVPVAFDGHPEHFTVFISEESGATTVVRGM